MSGQATGWVGLYGPHPDHIDRHGNPYGGRARGLRMVLLAVADAANREGRHAHPGVENVAGFSLYSQGQCRRLLGELVEEGWLVITEGGQGGRGKATVYDLVMDPAENRHLETRASCASSDEPAGGETRAPRTETRASEAETRASGCATNGTSNGLATNQPPSTPPADDEQQTSPPAECDHRGRCEHFEDFWQRYPRRVGVGDAIKAYRRATNHATTEQILDGLARSMQAWRSEQRSPRFLPYPATWLNQQRWLDEDQPTAPEPSRRAQAEAQLVSEAEKFLSAPRPVKEITDGAA